MKFLNVDVDDLFLLATASILTSKNTVKSYSALEFELGSKIDESIPTNFYFGSKAGVNSPDDVKPYRSSFLLKEGYDSPFIYDTTIRVAPSKQDLLLTGLLSKDGKSVTNSTTLLFNSKEDLDQVKVIAGGIKPHVQGGVAPLLLITKPQSMSYRFQDEEHVDKKTQKHYNSFLFSCTIEEFLYKKGFKTIR